MPQPHTEIAARERAADATGRATAAGATGAAVGANGDATAHRAPPHDMRLQLDVEIPSDVRYIEPAVALVQRQCALFEYPARQCALNVPVALSEALSNAVLRGNQERPGTAVRMRASLDHGTIVLEVEDEGAGFDLEQSLNDPADPGNLEREDGRGLFLMRALMDRVERVQGRGNVVRLTLHRA